MSTTPIKNLTVRLDPETREQLELIANRELRPMANQIVLFVRRGIADYIKENDLEFQPIMVQQKDGSVVEDGLTLEKREITTMDYLDVADLPAES